MSEYSNNNNENDGGVKKFKSAEDFKEYFLETSKFQQCSSNRNYSFVYDNNNKRRASIPASLNNYNVRVYDSRRYSEIVLGPTVTIHRERLSKSDTNSASKINGCLGDTLSNLNKRFKSKNQITQSHENDINNDNFIYDEEKNEIEENGKQVSRAFINHLEDTAEESDGIMYESDKFRENENELQYRKSKGSKTKRKSWDRNLFYYSNEGDRSMANDHASQSRNRTSLIPDGFENEIVVENEDLDGKFPFSRKNSTDIPHRINIDVNRCPVRSDAFQRRCNGQTQEESRNQNDTENCQNNLKTVVLSYFNLSHTKWDLANVNGTRHWEKRLSRATIHPISNSISRDVFGPKISAISDEETTTSSPHFIDKHDNVSRINDIEYASGGLLSAVDEELPPSAPYRPPKSETLLFSDGKRRIDMVLVYEEEDLGVMRESEALKKEKRRSFRENLEREGLEFELEDKKVSFDEKTYFLKIHAPWQVMTRYAELMNIKMPIKAPKQQHDFKI